MRAEHILKDHPFGNALMFFAARFLPIAALIVAVTVLLGLTLNYAELEKLKLNQLSFLNLGEQALGETVDQSLGHLRGLLHEPAINRAFEHPAEVANALMAEHLQTLMYRNPIYDKARWLSAAGQELVRINREGDKPVVVPLADLQDKSARYYYRDAIGLPPGHIYLSPLDLNVEREVVEVPYKPMIRIAIRLPVVAGRDQGLLVVNLRAQILLDHLRRLASREPEHGYMLLNPQGFWLMGPDPQETWGFMFGRDTTLAQRQPLEWGQIASEHHGQIRTADGLWSWITFHPEGLDPETIQAAEHWKLVTQVPAAEIQDLLWQHSRPMILIAALTLALFGAGIVLYRQLLLKKERAEAELAEVSAKRTAEVLAANTALRESEEKFRSLVETTSDCIWEVDPQGCFTYLSPQFRHRLGYDPAEFLGRSPQDLIPAEDADQVSEGFKAIVASRQPFAGLQQHNIRRDGRVLTMEISGIPIFSPAGEYQGMRGITRDITARKQAELALDRSRAELEQAQALAHLGSWTLDFASNRMEWSPEVYRISGMAPGTPVDPQSHIRLVHPDDFDFFEAAWQATLQGAPYDITHRIIVAGRVKWVHARAEIAFDAEGQPQSAIGTLQDITEHKEAEDALRQSQVFLQGVLDSVSSHIAVLDRAGVIVAVNEAWRRFSRENSSEQGQLAPHTDIGTNYLSICSADAAIGREDAEEAANIRDGIRAVLDGRLPTFSLEYPCPSPHEQRWFLMTVTPLGRRGAGAVVVHTNISERKRYEQALQQARNVAETANRAKSEFLAHMSHEIRTPLNAVLGLSQVLNHEPLTADQRVMVDRIQAAGQSLLAILNDILDFSKIEAGQLRLERRPFELGALLAKLDSLMGQAAQTRGLALRIAPPFAPPGRLVGDALRLEQVLINLLGNAIKFTEQGEVDLQVQARETGATVVRLRFTVRDTGIGIAPEALARLFAPFTQAEAGITRRFGGTGLGLAICKRLVELMDGEIGVESQVGRGSTFWFELPFARVVDGATVEKPAPERPSGPRLTGLHFLVVDDNAVNRDVVVRVLKLEGATATLAADGQQAVQLLQTRPAAFDAVLMDVQMPVMDGLTATRLIRGELGLTELPILAFTAGVLPEEQQAALAAGCNAVLAKPVNLKQMAVQLLNWVTPRSAGAGAATD